MVISVVVVVLLLPPSVTISIEIYFRDFLLLSCRRRIHVVNSNRIRPENAQRTANSSKQAAAANSSLVCGVTVSCVAFGKRANERENEWQLRCS